MIEKKKRYTGKGQRIKGVLNLFICIIIYIFLCIHLTAPGLLCSRWDLVPRQGTEPRSPALGAQCLTPWATREVPRVDVSKESPGVVLVRATAGDH